MSSFVLVKQFIIVCPLLFVVALTLSAQDVETFTQTGSEELSLNGSWQFTIDSLLSESQEWTEPSYQSEQWDQLTVPGNWDTENDYANFRGTGYYRKPSTVPSDWDGSVARLYFGAVYQTCEVWLNGQYLGKHVGGYTPFEFDVTGIIQPGQRNVVALSANNEYGYGAWWHWGGISREVKLLRNNEQRIVWQHIVAEPDLATERATINASIKIANPSNREFSGVLVSNIQECASCPPIETEIIVPARSEASSSVSFTLAPEEVQLWDFDNPRLYHLQTSLKTKENERTQHTVSDRFGIRKIETRGDKLLLNGEAIRLNGFNRVADHRAYGQTEPDHIVKFDIDAMKAMGSNFTRIMHYPQATNLLDYCDEVGMLLIEEIPVWGKGNPELTPDNPLTKQWLREMIERDYNHPSVVGWSVANEIADAELEGRKMSPKVYEYVKTMLEYVHSLD
ncbi:MAG: glycoside hydrolase family 2 TIM barrel-domain containing protein, partial [Tunicatimonas sp.]